MAGAIVDLSTQKPPRGLTVEVCVIGSGAAGGTAARVLAEAGHEVAVLEEGADFTGDDYTQRDAEMYDQLYMDRGGRASEDLSVTVLQGRVLGGGPEINACDVVPIPAAVLHHWQKRHGLSSFTEEALAPHLAGALEDLSARPIPDHMVNRANDLLRQGAASLKLRGEVMDHNRVGCAKLGTCFLGCPVGAKRTPRTVAIPKAIAAGARFFVRARAVKIEQAGAELKTIRVRTLDAQGHHETGSFTLQARVVVVAANAIATPQLLLRSGIGNEHVGRHLMLQPQLPVLAHFVEKVNGFEGIPQSYAITEHEVYDHPEHGLWGFRVEGVFGTPGIVATMLPFDGQAGKSIMTQYPHSAGALLLVPDQPSGTVTLKSSGRPQIDYEQRPDHKERVRHAVRVAAQAYLAAGARRVVVPYKRPLVIRRTTDLALIDRLLLEPATSPLISAHQQGTVRFAPSASDGAADPDGRVYGTRDVYVFDSSGFPSSSSSHTMTPIMTVSRFLSSALAARLG